MRGLDFRFPCRPTASRARVTGAFAALPVALALCAGGCTVARPDARATDARIIESAGAASKVEIALSLRNPSKDEVELVEYDYVVTLPDGAAYGGKWAALRALPPERTVEATIPAVLPTASLRDGATSWRVSGTLRYRDPQSFARILYEAGILRTEVGFSGAGTALKSPAKTPAKSPGAPAGQ